MSKEVMPPPLPLDPQLAVRQERLRLLSIAYYISGGIGVAMVSFLLLHLGMCSAMCFVPESAWKAASQPQSAEHAQSETPAPQPNPHETPPVVFFGIMAGVIGVIILCGWTISGLTIYAGRCIKRRERRTFVLIMAGINCVFIPYGTVLGIATFLTVSGSDAKMEFVS